MWDLVLEMAQQLAIAADKRLTSADVAAICDALEDASVSWDRSELKEAGDTLERAFRALLAEAPNEARRAVSGMDSTSGEAIAYTLGQIGFAQAFASRAYERRAEASFAATLVEQRFEKIVRALAEHPSSGVELSTRVGITEEAISRSLKELREKGVTDYRRDGARFINFLTPPAAALVKSMGLAHLPPSEQGGREALRARTADLPDHLQQTPVLESSEAARRAA